MKTPMQELIEKINDEFDHLDDCKMFIEEYMLEKEKEMIISVYSDGLGNGMHYERGDAMDSVLDELNYYDKTFNTKER